MDLLETLRALLDHPTLMEDYNYSQEDLDEIDLSKEHPNEFIRFMQIAIRLMQNENESIRVTSNKLLKFFDPQ